MQRVLRRRPAEQNTETASRGRLIVFAPVKGGSGASTLAANVAYQVKSQISGKVLLADFDVTQGVLSFTLRVNHQYAVTDALHHAGEMDRKLWGSLVVERKGVDLLLAPERPEPALIEPYPVQAILEHARNMYDVVVVDLGGVCESMSMATLSAAQDIYLVCSGDLPSLYMMRRTIPLVEEMGYSRDQIRVVVNRLPRRSELSLSDMERIFRASVHATFPEDRPAVLAALRDGDTIADNSDLSTAVRKFVKDLVGQAPQADSGGFGIRALKELLSGT
jgi:pilus assembly protein CpaE